MSSSSTPSTSTTRPPPVDTPQTPSTSSNDAPVPRSRRSSHRSTRSAFSPSLRPAGWRAAAPGLGAPAQPVAASVSAVHAAAPASGSGSSGSAGVRVGAKTTSAAAAAATRAMQAGSAAAEAGTARRRGSSGSRRVEDDDTDDNAMTHDEQRFPTPSKKPSSSSLYVRPRRPSTSPSSATTNTAALSLSVHTHPTPAATIIQPSATASSSTSTSWLTSITRKGKQAARPSPAPKTPIGESAAEFPLVPTTPSSIGADSNSADAARIASPVPSPIPSSTPPSTPPPSSPAPPSFHVHPPTPALEQGPIPPLPSPSPSPASVAPAPSRPPPARTRSWFPTRGSAPSSPSKPSLMSAVPSASAVSLPLPAPTASTSSPASTSAAREGVRTPTPPPLPKTPPPTYPLELQLEVDSVVDATAMLPGSVAKDGDEGGDEPPVYTPTERAPGVMEARLQGGKGKEKHKQMAVEIEKAKQQAKEAEQVKTKEDVAPPAGSSGTDTPRGFVLAFPLLGRTKVPLGLGRGLVGGRSREELRERQGEDGKDEPSAAPEMQIRQEDSGSGAEDTKVATNEDRISPRPSSLSTSTHCDPSPGHATHSQVETPPQASTQTDSTDDSHPHEPAPPSDLDVAAHVPPPSGAPTAAAGASWWGYVGWGLTGAGSLASPSKEDSIAAVEAQMSEAVRLARAADEREAEELRKAEEERITREQDEEDEAKVAALVQQVQEEDVSAATITKTTTTTADAATGAELSAWLTPWTWYYSSATTTSINNETDANVYAPEAETAEEKEITGTTRTPPIDDTPPPPPMQDPEPTLASPTPPAAQALEAEPINPIAASITSNTSGWASFFSSRALVGRTLGYGVGASARAIENVQRDEHGAEVMEVDFSEDGQGLEIPEAAQRGRGGETKPVGGANGSRSPSLLHPSASPPRPRVSSITRAPPLQISAEVRKDSARLKLAGSGGSSRAASAANTPVRGRSPAMDHVRAVSTGSVANAANAVGTTSSTTTSAASASTTSAISNSASTLTTTTTTTTTTRPASPTPTLPAKKPAPPNLVLPTWSDTFHVAPRSIPPPKPKPAPSRGASGDAGATGGAGVLGKTLHFMNHVLFAKDSPNPSGHAQGLSASAKGKGRANAKGKERVVQRTFSSGSGASTSSDEGEPRLSLIEQDRRARFAQFGRALPKAWSVVNGVNVEAQAGVGTQMEDVLRGCRRVVVIGVHGWFPGAMIRTVLGEPTGTSTKFASMMEQALHAFEAAHGVQLEKITQIPLEGDGTIARRVEKLYANLQANAEWMADLHAADAVLIATHSQGSVVSTHLLARLIRDGHIVTARSRAASAASDAAASAAAMDAGGGMAALALGMGSEANENAAWMQGEGKGEGLGGLVHRKVQRVCVLALCGIHLGPLRYLSSSTLVGPYLQYFESTAARELFEFQNTESAVSKAYVDALNTVLDHGTKVLYVASLNDQVVPIYSGLFTAASHPLILRALYIDGDAYHSSDFLSNLLVLLLRILNAGMSDSGLLAHLSEATAGSLNGVGHSTAYEEVATYSLAVQYLFMADEGVTEESKLEVESFNATQEQNDYEIPWSLREVIADERVAYFFGKEIAGLRDAFREWHPKTTILRDLKRKLQPIQRLSSTFSAGTGTSKL